MFELLVEITREVPAIRIEMKMIRMLMDSIEIYFERLITLDGKLQDSLEEIVMNIKSSNGKEIASG